MVGMLAAGGALDQIGRRHGRAWGSIADPAVRDRVLAHVRAAAAARSLEGSTFGRIGGRPMGMYTAVSNPDQWMSKFGVDVEEIDQLELVRRSEQVADGPRARGPRVARAPRRRRPLRRRAADARAARAPDPLVLRDARADRGVEPRLQRHQGPARADDALRDDGRHRGVPQRPLRLGRPEGDARLRDRGRHGRRADDAAAARASAGRRCCSPTSATTTPTATSGTSATRASTRPGSPRAATIRPRTCATSTCTRRTSSSRPAAPRSTTSRRRATSPSRG